MEPLSVGLGSGDTLHVARFCGSAGGTPVVMFHGAIENGRIFYSSSGKGLAPFLAVSGFDVFVADMRGKGKSSPPIARGAAFGQTEAITEEIPAVIEAVRKICGDRPQMWVAHSWGGVLLTSFLARFPEYLQLVKGMVFFGSKRNIRGGNFWKLLKVDLVWNLVCPLACRIAGYLPAKHLKIGSDNESTKFYKQSADWVRSDAWVGDDDGFDYGAAVETVKLPPTWHIAAISDHALGHPDDVRRFMESAGEQERRFSILSRKNGNLHDYNHINMLTHPDANRDHFPKVAAWLKDHDRAAGMHAGVN